MKLVLSGLMLCVAGFAINAALADERFELIPFSDEIPSQNEIDDQYELDQLPSSEGTETRLPDRLVITLGHEPLYVHLIKAHKCPEWVAILYKHDTKNLIRIHKGYELKGLHDGYSEEQLSKTLKTMIGSTEIAKDNMRSYYSAERKHYGRFKMFKVKLPQ